MQPSKNPNFYFQFYFTLSSLIFSVGCKAEFEVSRSDSSSQVKSSIVPSGIPTTSTAVVLPEQKNPINTLAKINVSVKVDLSKLTKITTTAPILTAFTIGSSNCGSWLFGAFQDLWGASASLVNNQIVFSIPCKYNDLGSGGWHLLLATWDGISPSGSFIDGDSGTAGIQEKINKNAVASDALIVGDIHRTIFTSDSSGNIYGVGGERGTRRGAQISNTMPILANDLLSFSVASYQVLAQDVFRLFSANDNSWQGSTDVTASDIFYDNGLFYFYVRTYNSPTNNTSFLVVSSSPDNINWTPPTSYLVQGYSHANVSKYGSQYFMIAFDEVAQRWKYIEGSSPLIWNFANATSLYLENFIGTSGAWDATLYTTTSNNEPTIIGAKILNDNLLIFYMAGIGDGNTFYNDKRSIGVLSAPIVRAN